MEANLEECFQSGLAICLLAIVSKKKQQDISVRVATAIPDRLRANGLQLRNAQCYCKIGQYSPRGRLFSSMCLE